MLKNAAFGDQFCDDLKTSINATRKVCNITGVCQYKICHVK